MSGFERIRSEVNSKCSTLRAASRLLEGLTGPESDEMLLLMSEEALRLAKALEARRGAQDQGGSFPTTSRI
jgi:hypothetical protein